MIFIFSVLELFTFPSSMSEGDIRFSYINVYSIYGLSAFNFTSSVNPYAFSLYFSGDSIYKEGVFVYKLKKRVNFIEMEAGSGLSYLSFNEENILYPYFELSIGTKYKMLKTTFSAYMPGIKNTNIYGFILQYSTEEYGVETSMKVYNTGVYTISGLIYVQPFNNLGFGVGTTLPQGYINLRLFLKAKGVVLDYRMFYNEIIGRGDILSLSFYLQ